MTPFLTSTDPEPHRARSLALLEQHPELRKLFGHQRSSAIIILALVAAQLVAARVVTAQHWWVIFLVAYTIGAAIDHALFVFIHECAHNLVFRTTFANKLIALVANLPIVFPAAIGFRKFHLEHHRFQGDFARDADISGLREARWVGNSALRKALWLLFYCVIEGLIRPGRIRSVKVVDRWTVTNLLVQLAMAAGVFHFFGGAALAYLGLCLAFAIGLHPLGARWIQEHFVVHERQETYSYYGPLNAIAFNVGFHNEHHDLVQVAWSKLPEVKRQAPEFYAGLYAHRSWTKLLVRFIFDPQLSLYCRITR